MVNLNNRQELPDAPVMHIVDGKAVEPRDYNWLERIVRFLIRPFVEAWHLYLFLDGKAANMPLVMLALAIFGAGQGLFISPNSSAIMATAPEELTGEAGSLLNVVRYLGISTGIAGASTVLALGIAAAPGSHGITMDASAATLVFASRAVISMLAVLAVFAGALSLMRTVPRKARGAHAVEL